MQKVKLKVLDETKSINHLEYTVLLTDSKGEEILFIVEKDMNKDWSVSVLDDIKSTHWLWQQALSKTSLYLPKLLIDAVKEYRYSVLN